MKFLHRVFPDSLFIQSSSIFTILSYGSSASSGNSFMVCSKISSSNLVAPENQLNGRLLIYERSALTWLGAVVVGAPSRGDSSRSAQNEPVSAKQVKYDRIDQTWACSTARTANLQTLYSARGIYNKALRKRLVDALFLDLFARQTNRY